MAAPPRFSRPSTVRAPPALPAIALVAVSAPLAECCLTCPYMVCLRPSRRTRAPILAPPTRAIKVAVQRPQASFILRIGGVCEYYQLDFNFFFLLLSLFSCFGVSCDVSG